MLIGRCSPFYDSPVTTSFDAQIPFNPMETIESSPACGLFCIVSIFSGKMIRDYHVRLSGRCICEVFLENSRILFSHVRIRKISFSSVRKNDRNVCFVVF
ncbi:hypothetical protein ASJ83_05240 [Methanocorpusculum parvum]|uniref:Uncharacterized protein n=1 Tax=Methanocorpusculum parvum TaxID=2193 RepID=A0AAX0Q8U7_9EURY|nr:hypothetical protein ASJ83_05240 [Methanocorpusculum parvum]